METHHVHKSIGVVCCVALAVAVAGAVSERPTDTRVSPHSSRGDEPGVRMVYVDLDRLEKLHPAWGQLAHIERARYAVATERERRDFKSMSSLSGDTASSGPSGELPEPDVLREALQERLARDAQEQIVRVGASLAASSRERIDARAEELVGESALEMAERERQAELIAMADLRSMMEEWRPERANEQLRQIVLRNRVNVSGQDSNGAAERAAEYEAQQKILEERRKSRAREVMARARDEVEVLRQARQGQIERELKQLESEERRQVEEQLADYRARLMPIVEGVGFGDLPVKQGAVLKQSGSGGFQTGKEGSWIADPATSVVPSSLEKRSKLGVSAAALLTERHEQLASRIRDDMKRTVERAASQKNVEVVFSRSEGVPDYTEYFLQLLSNPARLGRVLSGLEETVDEKA